MTLPLETILFYGVLGLYFGAMILYFLFVAVKKEGLGKGAMGVQTAGLFLHTTAIVLRGVAAGRLPLTNQYEFASAFAWGLCLVSLLFILKFRFTLLGAFAAPITFIIIGYAALQSKEIRALMPALQSNWLGFHVSTAIIAYGAFGVSCVLGIIFLLRDRMKASTGAIWAERAWGSYWSWDPKETWSLVTWLVYATYLHLRIRRGWQGKSAAIFAVVGFVCVIFTYIGVNALLPGVHSYK